MNSKLHEQFHLPLNHSGQRVPSDRCSIDPHPSPGIHSKVTMRTIELCAGAGGQAIGLHMAGATHAALVELDAHACATLRKNNNTLALGWGPVLEQDLKEFAENEAHRYKNAVDLVAGGVPCPPFSKAGKQLGNGDERDLFPAALEVVRKVKPTAVLLENVPGLLETKFQGYRKAILNKLSELGYEGEWRSIQASDFGVPQLRPRAILIAFRNGLYNQFEWPKPFDQPAPTVGETLFDLMSSKGWRGATKWRDCASDIAPTVVGGSHKHGGPDLGPTRAKQKWFSLGVNAHRVGADDEIPNQSFKGVLMRNGTIREGYENFPLLTVRMVARIQGFPDYWEFSGSKTHAYRQVGNAFPPPVAKALGEQIKKVVKKQKPRMSKKSKKKCEEAA